MAKINKTDEEWRTQLSPEQFHVTRQAGTERSFTGPYWDSKEKGSYKCICCGSPLFRSETKFDSGTGWPSFFEAIAPDAVEQREDNSLSTSRTEIVCATCDAHLGHVFDDGPQPTGLRYCMNGTALDLEKDEDA